MTLSTTALRTPLSRHHSILFAALLLVLGVARPTTAAPAPTDRLATSEVGNVCVDDLQPSATCTKNDIFIEDVLIVTLFETCTTGVYAEAEATFEIEVSTIANGGRFDIGLFLALDQRDAYTGDNCLHSYLAPPVSGSPAYSDYDEDFVPDLINGPWWDGDLDSCGDFEPDTELFLTLGPVRFSCRDRNGNGFVDLATCTSWDPASSNNSCNSISDAYPKYPTNCDCRLVDVPVPSPEVFIDGFEGGDTLSWSATVPAP